MAKKTEAEKAQAESRKTRAAARAKLNELYGTTTERKGERATSSYPRQG